MAFPAIKKWNKKILNLKQIIGIKRQKNLTLLGVLGKVSKNNKAIVQSIQMI